MRKKNPQETQKLGPSKLIQVITAAVKTPPAVKAEVKPAADVKKPAVQPLPESVVALHKAKGADGLSNAEYFGEQGWINLKRIQRRLEKEGLVGEKLEEGLLKLYAQLVVNEDDGVVPCFYPKDTHAVGVGQGRREVPNEVLPRRMAFVNEEGSFVYTYTDPETGKRLETTDPAKGEKLKTSGSFLTKLVFTREKVTGGLICVCPLHRERAMKVFKSPGLAYDDATARLESILANQNDIIQRKAGLLRAEQEAGVKRPGGDQMSQAFQHPRERSGGRPHRK